MIYIYASINSSGFNSPAVDPTCAKFTENALLSIGIKKNNIVYLHNKEALAAISEKKPTVIIPGGRFSPLMKDLLPISGKISSLVRKGGVIVGICSGAMLLCSKLIAENTLYPSKNPSVLTAIPNNINYGPFGLASLVTKNPVFRHPNETAKNGLIPSEIKFLPTQVEATMPFAEGSTFLPFTSWNGAVTAKYPGRNETDGNIAAWRATYGKGKIIGIGFHPELPLPGSREPEAAGLAFLREELDWAGVFDSKEPS